jgi:hypothetical protein
MAGKTKQTETRPEEQKYDAAFDGEGGAFDGDFNIEDDFNTDDEYKPTPLIPRGSYHANVTDVKFDSENQAIVWVFCLADNGGYMSDGDTQVDGATITYKNWLPKPGDESELTKSGRMTKRQAKINMLSDFGKAMGIDVTTPKAIVSALQNGEWIGLSVMLTIGMREYEGRTFNDISKVAAG